MKRRQADLGAGLLVGAVLLVGFLFTWDAYRQQQAFDGQMDGMMGGSGMMGDMMYSGPDPLWYLLGTLVLAGVLGASYLLLRSAIEFDDAVEDPTVTPATAAHPPEDMTAEPDPSADRSTQDAESESQPTGAESSRPAILDVLPDDERKVLEPVVESPGLTQIALRDRSGFSKSKVSQTASELEKRGLIYREKQGRTYRVYPSDDLQER